MLTLDEVEVGLGKVLFGHPRSGEHLLLRPACLVPPICPEHLFDLEDSPGVQGFLVALLADLAADPRVFVQTPSVDE